MVQRRIVRGVLCGAILLGLVYPGAGASAEAVRPIAERVVGAPANAVFEALALQLINRDRTTAGLPPLHVSVPLRTAARRHGRDLFARGVLSHRSTDGRDLRDRVVAAGLAPLVMAENLAYAADVLAAHRGLMRSPGHRQNILSPLFIQVGIGVLDGGRQGVIVVQNFAD